MINKTFASYRRSWHKFTQRDDGSVAITFALALLPLTLGVGAAVDFSRGNQVKTNLQGALDGAVLAAAINGSAQWQSAALNAFNANVNTSKSAVAAPTFTLANGIYSGSASASLSTTFVAVVGISSLPIGVSAAATTSKISLCVLALNSFEKGAFDMNGNAKFNAPNCGVHSNTRDSMGMTQEGSPKAVAKAFSVTGGHTGNGYSTQPKNGSDSIADPYASMPFPYYSNCDGNSQGLDINSDTTLSPGTYCGGIRIKNGAKVVLNPGNYVMVGGSFWLNGGSSVTGNEVLIAFTGADSTLRVWGDSKLNLTSPTSGTYKNFQFFQDPNDVKGRGAWVSIGGNGNTDDGSKASWDGIAYFPTQNFWVYGNAVVNANSPNMSIVAGQVWVQGNATVNLTNDNPRNLDVTQTTTAGGARLIR